MKRLREFGILVQDGFGQLLWPGVCESCGEGISGQSESLCRECWEEVLSCSGGDYCMRCGRDASRYGMVGGACADCQGRGLYFDGIARGGVYKSSLRKMILAFKNGRSELNAMLGFLVDSALKGSDFFEEVDFFVPVPLHWSRRLARGYNQSCVLAGRFGHSSAKINTELVRVRRTKSQPVMVSHAARARNVAGAFAVRRGHGFRGKVVCLVDDIKTSGATLNECARTLKLAGAAKVYAVVAAVAGQDM